MPINPEAVGDLGSHTEISWDSKDSLLYALGVGAGADDPTGFELGFTTENSQDTVQRALPTQVVVMGAGGVDFGNMFVTLGDGAFATLAEAQEAGAATINYGVFINTLLDFLIVAFAIFMVVRAMNKMKKEEEKPKAAPTTRDCPQCLSSIPIKASRCGHCTSEVPAG